jgi:hypothetical protein
MRIAISSWLRTNAIFFRSSLEKRRHNSQLNIACYGDLKIYLLSFSLLFLEILFIELKYLPTILNKSSFNFHLVLALHLGTKFYIAFAGEKLEGPEVDIIIADCCEPEDDDGFINYVRKYHSEKSILKYLESIDP